MGKANKQRIPFAKPPQVAPNINFGAPKPSPASSDEIQITISTLPEPERIMVVNYVDVQQNRFELELIFGQILPGRSTLAAALIVHMSRADLKQALFGGDNGLFVRQIKAFVAEEFGEVAALSPLSEFEPARFVLERATIATFAFATMNADIRFYQVSASAVQRAKKTGRRDNLVVPIVEISMSTVNLLALINKVEPMLEDQMSPTLTRG